MASKRRQCEQRLADLKTERSYYEPIWSEVAEYIAPDRYRPLRNEAKGKNKQSKIIHAAATKAWETLTSGLMTGITSPARPWFKLTYRDSDLNEQTTIRDKLSNDQRDLERMFRESNTYPSLQSGYADVGLFGTECLLLERNENFLRGGIDHFVALKLTHIPVGEFWLATNSLGRIDTMYREMSMTASQIVERWEKSGNVSQNVINAYSNNNIHQKFTIVHAIEPRRDYDPKRKDRSNMPYASLYWEEGTGGEIFLEESGYEECPILAPRWDVSSDDVYGWSPAMRAIGHIKTLQSQEMDLLRASEMGAKPPVYAPALSGQKLSIRPGSINYISDDPSGVGMRAVFQTDFRTADLQNAKQQTIEQINSFFFSDLFLMISQLDNVRTATEISVRQEEKMLMLGPVVERFQKELLKPLIDRSYSIMHRAGMLSDDPDEIIGKELGVDYISSLAQGQKAVATQGIERFVGFVGNLSGVNPDVIDKIDLDQAVDIYGDFVGVPPSIIRSDDEVQKLRDQRAQQQQAMQQQQAIEGMAPAMKQGAEAARILSETDADMTGGGTLLDQMGLI